MKSVNFFDSVLPHFENVNSRLCSLCQNFSEGDYYETAILKVGNLITKSYPPDFRYLKHQKSCMKLFRNRETNQFINNASKLPRLTLSDWI